MSKPLNLEGLHDMSVNARTRKRWQDYEDAKDLFRTRFCIAAVMLARGAGLELSDDSPVHENADEVVLNWRPAPKPQAEMCADVVAVLEAALSAFNDMEDRLNEYLEHQEALTRLRVRQASGKR